MRIRNMLTTAIVFIIITITFVGCNSPSSTNVGDTAYVESGNASNHGVEEDMGAKSEEIPDSQLGEKAPNNISEENGILYLGGEAYSVNSSTIFLDGDKVTEVEAVLNFKKVTELTLSNYELKDLNILLPLTELKTITIQHSEIEDISALAGLKELSNIDLSDNKIRDISALKSLEGLEYLNLSNNQVEDLSPLSSLNRLKVLDISGNNIFDITALSSCKSLTVLSCNHNKVSSLDALSSLESLTELYMNDNSITDLRPLVNVPLDIVYLTGNPLDSPEVLDHVDTFVYNP